MTNRISSISVAAFLCLTLGACGGSGAKPAATSAPSATPPTTLLGGTTADATGGADGPSLGPDTAAESAQLLSLRVLGTNNPGYSAVLLGVKLLEVSVNGAPVAVDFSNVQATFDLANGTHAWLAGRFPMPAPGSEIAVTLTFDDAGGYTDAVGSGQIAGWALPVRFSAPVEWLALRGHAVIHLDLARSLLAGGAPDTKVLLPNLQVRF